MGQGQRPTGSHPAVLQVPRVGPATEHLRHRLLYTAAALIRAVALGPLSPGQDRPRQAATVLDRPRCSTSAGSRRPARPGVKGLGPLPPLGGLAGASRAPRTTAPFPPTKADDGWQCGLEASGGSPSGPPSQMKPGRTWPEREPRGKHPPGPRRPRVNYLSCSRCLKRFFSF